MPNNKYTIASKNPVISIAPEGSEIIKFTPKGSILTPTVRNPSPTLGEVYLDSSDDNIYAWNGLCWIKQNGVDSSFVLVNQPGHGYTTGQAIYFDGTDWLLAKADSYLTLGQAIVEYIDADNFKAVFSGIVTGLTGLTNVAEYYFVSDTVDGLLVPTEPTDLSSFSNPLLLLLTSEDQGIVLNFRPSALAPVGPTGPTGATGPSGSSFLKTFNSSYGSVFTITHNLNSLYNIVTVYDNDGYVIIPDQIKVIDGNSIELNITSAGVITGNWTAVIVSGGGLLGATGGTGPTGPKGNDGFSLSYYKYQAKTGTISGNPGNGFIIWNNASQTSATQININHLTTDSIDVDVFLSLLENGNEIIIQDASDSDNYQIWEVNGSVTIYPNSYVEIPVSYQSGGYSFSNNQNIILIIYTSGPAGPTGPTGATGPAGPTGPTGVASAAGLDKYVQFNDGGTNLGGSANFTFNKVTNDAYLNGKLGVKNSSPTYEVDITGDIRITNKIYSNSLNVPSDQALQALLLYLANNT